MKSLKPFAKQCTRVWYLMKKPDKQEFSITAKVAAIGLALIGVIGFAINMGMKALGIA